MVGLVAWNSWVGWAVSAVCAGHLAFIARNPEQLGQEEAKAVDSGEGEGVPGRAMLRR